MYYDCNHRCFSFTQLSPQSTRMFWCTKFSTLRHINSLHRSLASISATIHQIADMFFNFARRLTSILVCLYVIHLNLFIKSRQTMAEDKNETTTTVKPIFECGPPIDLIVDPGWLETVVFGNFRIWHILFSGIAIFIGITVVLCCLFRCRIPRTKQEIEADFLRKKITESFRTHLEKIKIDELQGQYDTGNLLTLFKKVELFEEDRIQKNEGFEKRKLTWRQKLKRLFSGKSSMDEYEQKSLDDSKGESADYKKMTEEEMETVEKEVEGAKMDSSALNMINDQIAIFGFIGESKKDRKKRIIELKKAEKAAMKEQKAQEKLEKKLAKQQPRKSIAGTSLSARSKSAKALLELRPDSLEKDQWSEPSVTKVSLENGGESIIIDIEDRGDVPDSMPLTLQELDHEQEDKGYQEISLAIPEKEEPPLTKKSFASKFSFRDTVSKLINFRSKPKQKEELVINIGLVRKDDDGTLTPPLSVTIPHIECSPPEPVEDEQHQQQLQQEQQHHKKKKTKMVKKDSVMAKDESLDRNLLQIPEISKTTKEINSERKSKVKEEKKKRKDKTNVSEPEPIYSEPDKSRKTKGKKPDKQEKAKSDSSKRTQLKRQTGADDAHEEKVKFVEPVETEKKDKKSKAKGKVEKAPEPNKHEKANDVKDATATKAEFEKKSKEKQKVTKFEETITLHEPETKPPKEAKSKHKKEPEIKVEPVREEPKKDKGKKKHLEFDDRNIEQTKFALRDAKEHKGRSDCRLESFPMVVEEVKTRQRKSKKESVSDTATGRHSPAHDQSTVAKQHTTKEHHQVGKSTKKSPIRVRDHVHMDSSKPHKPDAVPQIVPAKGEPEKRKDFNQMVTNLNEELKEVIDRRRKKQMKRSKTIVEDVIKPQEDHELRSRSRDEFKKRLSEVLLQRMAAKPDDADQSEQVASVSASVVQHTSNKSLDGTSSEMDAKSRQIRIMTKQATSSSEIEIPVEHVYTRGLAVVQVHPISDLAIEAQVEGAQIRHPVAPAPVTISTPPSPTPSRSSTISVVTDNLVKKLVESSPETGENRELTYERSRDVIFSVDQAQQQQPQPSTSSGASAKPKSAMKRSPPAVKSAEQSPSGRHRTKDKPKEKHKGRHH